MLDAVLLLGRYLFLALLTVLVWQLCRALQADLRRAATAPAEAAPSGPPALVAPDGRRWRLDSELTLGRAADNVIQLTDGFSSGHHARAWFDGQSGWLEDLGSTNGTRVEGRLLEPRQPVRLSPGARILLGEAEFSVEG